MECSIFIVEPDSSRSKQIVHVLLQSGYDALVIPDANKALRQLFQEHPDAVILSDRLPVAELDQLSDSITAMTDLPLIKLGDGVSPASIAQRLTCSTELPELIETLDKLLGRSDLHLP